MLVNDVDIQIVKPDGTVIGPWLLNPSNPAANATAPGEGNDDDRNNVKQVRIPAAQVVAGQTYTIRVKQDGALKVAVKQPGTTNFTLTGSQSAQPAFQNFAVVTSGNVDRAEDGFKITDFDRMAGLNYIEWSSVKGVRYRIQTSLDLVNWTTLPGDIDAIGETTSYTDQPADPGEVDRFYRVAEITP